MLVEVMKILPSEEDLTEKESGEFSGVEYKAKATLRLTEKSRMIGGVRIEFTEG